MASLMRMIGRQCLLRQTSCLMTRRSTMATKNPTAYQEMSNFWSKNKALKRPLSPHLSIYGYHTTMIMSITNRIAGIGMTAVVLGGSVIMLCIPGDFKTNLEKFKNFPYSSLLVTTFKYALSFAFVYHILYAIRHFVWDLGKGYGKATIIRSNFYIMAITAVMSIALVLGLKPKPI